MQLKKNRIPSNAFFLVAVFYRRLGSIYKDQGECVCRLRRYCHHLDWDGIEGDILSEAVKVRFPFFFIHSAIILSLTYATRNTFKALGCGK